MTYPIHDPVPKEQKRKCKDLEGENILRENGLSGWETGTIFFALLFTARISFYDAALALFVTRFVSSSSDAS